MFVDKCGTSTAMAPLHAWSPRGQRAHGEAPRNRGSNAALLARMGRGGMVLCVVVKRAITSAVYLYI